MITLDSAPEQVRRDRFGRPYIRPAEGGKERAYTRCTTYIGCLEDKFNLQLWKQRQVAVGLSMRPDLVMSVAAHSDSRADLDRLCREAAEAAGSSAAATTGTALHRMCERVDRGELALADVPAPYRDDVAAYRAVTAGIEWLHIEQMMVHDGLGVAGTPDRIGVLADDVQAKVVDIKTGSLSYGVAEIEMQLAVYANSVVYDVATGARTPVDVDLTEALVIHLPAGTGLAVPLWIDIAAGWESVQLAAKVREWRRGKHTPTSAWEIAIRGAQSADDLAAVWRYADTFGEWTDELTALARERKAALS